MNPHAEKGLELLTPGLGHKPLEALNSRRGHVPERCEHTFILVYGPEALATCLPASPTAFEKSQQHTATHGSNLNKVRTGRNDHSAGSHVQCPQKTVDATKGERKLLVWEIPNCQCWNNVQEPNYPIFHWLKGTPVVVLSQDWFVATAVDAKRTHTHLVLLPFPCVLP